ncbi:hypothetical protein JOB18_016321 [Solea senegalensis]|uniref:Uncharacterized protein n=1 Tax=Solea senegalensis TaxID=28829 RepID=A0AAV6S5Q4_SOLSE|nr:hypothetical protein JOB18_016321 [Solea senegalensis]
MASSCLTRPSLSVSQEDASSGPWRLVRTLAPRPDPGASSGPWRLVRTLAPRVVNKRHVEKKPYCFARCDFRHFLCFR